MVTLYLVPATKHFLLSSPLPSSQVSRFVLQPIVQDQNDDTHEQELFAEDDIRQVAFRRVSRETLTPQGCSGRTLMNSYVRLHRA